MERDPFPFHRADHHRDAIIPSQPTDTNVGLEIVLEAHSHLRLGIGIALSAPV